MFVETHQSVTRTSPRAFSPSTFRLRRRVALVRRSTSAPATSSGRSTGPSSGLMVRLCPRTPNCRSTRHRRPRSECSSTASGSFRTSRAICRSRSRRTGKKHPAAAGQPGVMTIGVDTFLAEPPRNAKQSAGAFPRVVCLVATEFAKGGAIDRREFFTQDRVRKGIAACLAALDAAGAQSVVMPLMGAASSATQSKDTQYEGQRLLKECRLLNWSLEPRWGSTTTPRNHRNIREIGLVQWEQEITDMFSVPPGSPAAESAQRAYSTTRIRQLAFNKGRREAHDGRRPERKLATPPSTR